MDYKAIAKLASVRGFDIKEYLEGMSRLRRSGLLAILREAGRVSSVSPATPNYEAYQNAVTHHAIGFGEALDLVESFKEIVLDTSGAKEKPFASFGAVERAMRSGDMTAEEAQIVKKSLVDILT